MTLFLYNTATRKKEPLSLQPGISLRLYTCGPTVYHYAHIGNFRTYLAEDLLRRTIEFLGHSVEQVMNITDVDDKTIRNAIAEGVSLDAFTAPYIEAFFADLKTLGVEPAEHYPRATEYIPEMIGMIEGLLEKGFAYQGGDGSVYFSIARFPQYGALSHLKLKELVVGASERVASDEYDKENLADFVLWKAYDPARDGEIFWESPFGRGRPGWHLECSAMARAFFGETIDLHCGGVDNIFPHHENEIAQSEAFSGEPFVRHWFHVYHLIVDGQKMSKSLGNFYTLRDLQEKGFRGREVRYLLIHAHYRSQLNFTLSELEGVRGALDRLQAFIRRLQQIEKREEGEQRAGEELKILASDAEEMFRKALEDDLNMPVALGVLFTLIRDANGLLDRHLVEGKRATEALEILARMDRVLGVMEFEEELLPVALLELAKRRDLARKERNFVLADSLRDQILAEGYQVEDTPQGPRLTPAS